MYCVHASLVLVRELRRHRAHQRVLAPARAEEHQLPLDELIGLSRKRGYTGHRRYALLSVTGRAQFGFLASRFRIARCGMSDLRRQREESRQQERSTPTVMVRP